MLNKLQKILDETKYWEYKEYQSNGCNVSVWNGEIYEVGEGKEFSYSVRVLYDNGWGFASSNKNDIEELAKRALKNAKIASKFNENKKDVFLQKPIIDSKKTQVKISPFDVSLEEKIKLLFEYDKLINDKRIVGKFFNYLDGLVNKKFFNSEGSEIDQTIIRTSVRVELYGMENGMVETNFGKFAKTGGFETTENFESKVNNTYKTLIEMLNAKSFKEGIYTCVADEELTAVIIHEALGHLAEADTILQKQSCLENLINKEISVKMNVIDDPTIEGAFGSFFYDDEGIPGSRKFIVKEGILKNLLHTRETAHKFNSIPGNARAQGNSIPIVRMSNTFIEPQDYKFEEMIEDIKQGFYLKGSRGGGVNPAKGSFQFYVNNGWKIENGEIKYSAKGISIAGETLEFLKNISAIGKDSDFSPGICGKSGQEVPVDGKNPKIKIKNLKIGKN